MKNTAATAITVAALALAVLHQDLWAWESTALIFGVLPYGLAYHALLSLSCGILWFCAVKFAWPDAIEKWAEEGNDNNSAANTGGDQ